MTMQSPIQPNALASLKVTPTTELEYKTFQLKAEGDSGQVRAVLATLGVEDAHHDIIMPGAFNGQYVLLSKWQHALWDELPVGKGMLKEEANELVLEAQYFMGEDNPSGREAFSVVKESEDLLEWSFGFEPVEVEYPSTGTARRIIKRGKARESSPVIYGAGVNTRTLEAKSSGQEPTSQPGDQNPPTDPGDQNPPTDPGDQPEPMPGMLSKAARKELELLTDLTLAGIDIDATVDPVV